ncbi:ROK family protein [Propionibacteriaceae bacterium Y2011]|uniref:ROK family protein n=1 Tax=Microlunatus sp. Y2014 TaxID=3418488 RepID=UPI003B4FC77C
MNLDHSPVLAVDVGGTKVALAVVTPDGRLLAERVVATATSADPELVWQPVGAAVTELVGAAEHAGPWHVGVGSAGPIDVPRGTVSPVNIAGWRGFDLVGRLQRAVRAASDDEPAVRLAGDGHCIAIGEHWLGAGRDLSSMVGMVISTGIGGGAVIDDRLFAGTTGNAVLFGHTSVDAWGPRCVCGGHGCVESYAGGRSMALAARARGWGGHDGRELTRDAAAGHPIAVEVIDRGMRACAAGIAATATNLDVATFVVGGGLAKAGEVVLGPLRRHLHDFATLDFTRGLELRAAELPNAGLLGAASLALAITGRGGLRGE